MTNPSANQNGQKKFCSIIMSGGVTMHTPKPVPEVRPEWHIEVAGVGDRIGSYGKTTDEVLDFCGRALYTNTLFDIILLRIRRCAPNQPEIIGDEFSDGLSDDTEWVLRAAYGDGGFRERQLTSKHELLAMLLAELRLGSTQIDVRHIHNVCERLE